MTNTNATRNLAAYHAALLGTVLLAAAATAGRAAVLHVPGDFTNLADAVTAATIGDTIALGAGTFPANIVFRKSLTLEGAGDAQTFLDGGMTGTVLVTTPGVTLTVRDLNVRHGKAPAGFGFGGGVLNDGDLRMERCTIWQGSAPVAGGALCNINGTAHLTDCTILNNDATAAGGGIDNRANLTLENCTITGNESIVGGAIINTGQLELINCTFFGNTAGYGGAMFLHSGTATVQYSTFNHNDATTGDGGAVLALTGFTAQGSLVAGNKARRKGPDLRGELDSRGYNLIGTNQDAKIVPLNGAGPDQVGTPGAEIDPRVGTLTSNGGPVLTLMPAPNSPAVDKGGASGFPLWDARGAHRPRDGGSGSLLADVGAVELGPLGYTATDLHRALQLTAGLATANAADGWLTVDATTPGVDLQDCAHLARKAIGLEQ
jgi:hypothetical protein